MGALSLSALGAVVLGPFVGPIIADMPALGTVGAVMANPIEATIATGIVAEGAAGASGALTPSPISGEALVVRGGNAANQTAAKIDAAIGPSRTPGVSGFSAQCNGGTCLSTLGGQLRNNQLGVMTADQIRTAGGNVVRTPGAGNHVTVTNLPGAKASPLMKIMPNPNPKKDP